MEKIFNFKKQFGQNFIFDKNFLNALVESFNLPKEINVLEIGAGMGTLSECLADHFDNVLSFEIDKTLTEHLNSLERKNLHFIFADILKQNVKDIENNFFDKDYYLIANLPYYITSQIIFKFLFDSAHLKSMFVMVQKEVGERFCAQAKNKEYGIPSVLISTFGSCKIVKNVLRKMFVPQPNVDSCILQIDINKGKFNLKNTQKYVDFVSNCFKMRRKTLINNLISFGEDKEFVSHTLSKMGFKPSVRPEELSCEDYVQLYNLLGHNK